MKSFRFPRRFKSVLASAILASFTSLAVQAQEPEYPPMEKIVEGFTQVESRSPDGQKLCSIWTRDKDSQMYLELPKDFATKKYFIALTVSSGDQFAGLQSGDFYVYFRQYNKRIAMVIPNMDIRSNGEPESKASVKRLFTDRILLDVPIVTMVPRGGALIDADALFVGQSGSFFGGQVRVSNPSLTRIVKAKAFSKNVEVAFEVVGAGGKLQTIHYSLSEIPEDNGYRPRKADERIGYFTTSFSDLGIYDDEKTRIRYVNRWRLEKRDPKLKISPPVEPIHFYIEHTTPVRYRRWVKEGIEYWNKAFLNVGFSDAIKVSYQDTNDPKTMELDPEDVQYNFVRWLNNDVGTAIGPSRVHPLTGEILDADIVLTDGWIRHFNFQFHDLLPELAMEGLNQESLSWLSDHPNWDPRLRMAPPSNQKFLENRIAHVANQQNGGNPFAHVNSKLLGDDLYDGLTGRTSQVNGYCLASRGKQMDMAIARMAIEMMLTEDPKPGDKPAEPKEELLDAMPESFIGPLLAELVAHEVGHTLGLRHNFKASGLYSLAEINSNALKGKKPLAGSVMDYLPINIPFEVGETQGDWSMIGIGPYDMWAIEYGYTPDEAKLPDILKRVAEPELQYATDEDTGGPDPLARRYDYSKDPLDYAENQIRLIKLYRGRLLEKFVKAGDSWAKARRGYELTLMEQTKALSMMANWIGGSNVNRDKKGDPGDRKPLTPVPVEQQRKAVNFLIMNSFRDEAFGLSPALLERLSVDKWADEGFSSSGEPTFPIHDRILGIQASAMTMLLNPSTLRRVLDNEQTVPADQDALTLPELLDTVNKEVWSELDAAPAGPVSARKPRISSFRRNLQREHVERLIDLTMPNSGRSASSKPISTIALMQLKTLKTKLESVLKSGQEMDPYSIAHITEVDSRIGKALNAEYVFNMPQSFGGGGAPMIIFGKPEMQYPTSESSLPLETVPVEVDRLPVDEPKDGNK